MKAKEVLIIRSVSFNSVLRTRACHFRHLFRRSNKYQNRLSPGFLFNSNVNSNFKRRFTFVASQCIENKSLLYVVIVNNPSISFWILSFVYLCHILRFSSHETGFKPMWRLRRLKHFQIWFSPYKKLSFTQYISNSCVWWSGLPGFKFSKKAKFTKKVCSHTLT
jgi:hypothetical protein